jgi:hypothetical protein
VVSRHYRIPSLEEPVGQGDIFLNVPVLVTLFDKHLIWDAESSTYRAEAIVGDFQSGMLLLSRIELKHAIVIDQSCDAPRATRVILAPLSPFTPEGKVDSQWKHISREATSLADPTRFYLPDEPSCGLGRHLAEFENKFDLPGDFLLKLIQSGKRVLTLSPEALGFLQFRLGTMYSRYARDDYAWPSVADLKLKQAYLNKQIENKEGEIKGWKKQAEKEETSTDEKQRLQVRITLQQTKVEEWQKDLKRCVEVIREQEGSQPVAAESTPASAVVAEKEGTLGQERTLELEAVKPKVSEAELKIEELRVSGSLDEGTKSTPSSPERASPAASERSEEAGGRKAERGDTDNPDLS